MDEVDEGDDHIPLPPIPTKPQKTLFSYFNSNRTVNDNNIEDKQATQAESNKRKLTNKDKDKNRNSFGISTSLFGGSAARKIKNSKNLKPVSNHESDDRSKGDVKYKSYENDRVDVNTVPEKNGMNEEIDSGDKNGKLDDPTVVTVAETTCDISLEDGKDSTLEDSQLSSQGNESHLNTTADESSKSLPNYQNARVIIHDCNADVQNKHSNCSSNDFEELNLTEEKCTASPITKVRKRRKVKQCLKSDTYESSATEYSDEESNPVEMIDVVNTSDRENNSPQKIASTPHKKIKCKKEKEKHFNSCIDEVDEKMEEPLTKPSDSPNKIMKKPRKQQQFESSDEELDLDSRDKLQQGDANNDSEIHHPQNYLPKDVRLSQNKEIELEQDGTKRVEITTVDSEMDTSMNNTLCDEDKCGNENYELTELNEEEPKKPTLIGSVYPASTNCSEYKGLIDLTDTSNVHIQVPVKNDCVSRTIEDYLKMLQTEYPEIPVRKIFMQFIDCQKTVISKNLTKVKSSRKVLETLWERDSKLKSEEIAIAEEVRRKEEEMALAELKKKMRNDIRSSFQRTKKRRRKKVDVDIVTVGDDDGSSHKSKEESSKDENNPKEIIVTEEVENEQFDTPKDNRKTGKKNRMKSKTKKWHESLNTLEGSDIGNVKNDIRSSFKRTKPTKMSKLKSSGLENPTKPTENTDACKEKEEGCKNKKITDMIEINPKEENCSIPNETINKSCKRSQRKRQCKTSETTILMDDIDDIELNSSQKTQNRQRNKPVVKEKVGSRNEVQCEEDNLPLVKTKKVAKQKRKSIIDLMKPKGSHDEISNENSINAETEKEVIECDTLENKEEKDVCNTNLIKSSRRKKNPSVDGGGDLNSTENKITNNAEKPQEIPTNKNKKLNRLPSPLEDVTIFNNKQNIVEVTNCKVEELDVSNTPNLDSHSENIKQSEINDEQICLSRKRRLYRSNSGSRKKMKLSADKPVTRRRSSRNQTLSIKLDESDDSESIDTVMHDNVQDVDVSVVSENDIKIENVCEKENIDKVPESTDGNVDTPNLRRSSRARKPVITYAEQFSVISESHVAKDTSISMSPKKTESPDVDVKNDSDDSIIETTSSQGNVEDTKVLKTTLDRAMETLDLLEQSPRKSPRKPIADVKLDEAYVNSCLSWTEKYQPNKARHVIGNKEDTRKIFDWLLLWKDRHESALRKMVRSENLSKQNKSDYSDSDDSDESEFEDYLSNTLVLTGPCGSGTTATVYACANQLDFKVLELNPTMYRTGKQIFDQVSEAVVSHQVNKLVDADNEKTDGNLGTKKDNFFKPKKELDLMKKLDSSKEKIDGRVGSSKSSLSSTSADAMSLILFEQVDITYDELDRGFYQGISDLRNLAKRPIILTANNSEIIEKVFPEDDSLVDHISLSYPNSETLLPMIQIICLVEHVFVTKSLLIHFMRFCKNDIRKTLLQLMFWCDQGKKPLFKIWKSKKKKSVNSNQSISELNIEETNEIATQDSTDDETISITELSLNILPVYKDESFLSIDRILDDGKCYSSVHTNFSFTKCTWKDQFSTLDNVAETSNDISEMNSMFSSLNRSFSDIHDYAWASTLSDSLSDDLPKERESVFNYPMDPICKNIQKIYEQKYEKLMSDQCQFNLQKNISHSELYNSALKSNSTKYHINRTPFLQDVLPYMSKICQIEELKLSGLHHRKRGNRRYTHYLDTCGMHLEEGPMKELSKPFV